MILNCIAVAGVGVFDAFEFFEDLLLDGWFFAERKGGGSMAVDMILYFFEPVADNELNLLEVFGSKKRGRVASEHAKNKCSDDARIVLGAVMCQRC